MKFLNKIVANCYFLINQQIDYMSNFGKKRIADFYLDPGYINVNHGSYGSCPREVMTVKRNWQQRMDFNTQKWFRGQSQQLIKQARVLISQKVFCSPNNIFIVQNATDAFNCLVKSMKWEQSDVVLLPNTAYAAIRKTVVFLQQRFNFTIANINFTSEDFASQQKILLKIENFVNSYPKKIKLAVFDHIVSTPGIVFPIQTIVQFMKEKQIPTFIDGAHAMSQVPIVLSDMAPDAYFSNFHKWAFSPKNAAFLYVSDEYLKTTKPALTGNFHGQGPQRQFYWTGTRDFSPYLSIQAGFRYLQKLGGYNEVYKYNHKLAIQAANKIAEIWGTKVMTQDQDCIGYLNNILVPSENIQRCLEVAKYMMDNENCYPIIYKFDNKIYTRISAQVYNELSDYVFMATKFKELLNSYEERNL